MNLTATRGVLLGLASLSLALATSLPARADQFSQSFRNDYLQTCRRDAQQAGLSPEVANRVCQCTLSRLQQTFTEAQLRSLMQRVQSTGETPQSLVDIGRECALEALR